MRVFLRRRHSLRVSYLLIALLVLLGGPAGTPSTGTVTCAHTGTVTCAHAGTDTCTGAVTDPPAAAHAHPYAGTAAAGPGH